MGWCVNSQSDFVMEFFHSGFGQSLGWLCASSGKVRASSGKVQAKFGQSLGKAQASSGKVRAKFRQSSGKVRAKFGQVRAISEDDIRRRASMCNSYTPEYFTIFLDDKIRATVQLITYTVPQNCLSIFTIHNSQLFYLCPCQLRGWASDFFLEGQHLSKSHIGHQCNLDRILYSVKFPSVLK